MLNPLDRLYSAATCRRVAEVVCDFRMLLDVRLVIKDAGLYAAVNVLTASQRRYTSLKLDQGEQILVLQFLQSTALLAYCMT